MSYFEVETVLAKSPLDDLLRLNSLLGFSILFVFSKVKVSDNFSVLREHVSVTCITPPPLLWKWFASDCLHLFPQHSQFIKYVLS